MSVALDTPTSSAAPHTPIVTNEEEIYVPFIVSDAHADPALLRRTMQTQGYLFFRDLVPVDDVMTVRHAVLEHCAQAGWLDSSRDLMDAIVAPGIVPKMEGQKEYSAVYRQVLKTPLFHDFPCHPALMKIAEILLGQSAFVHPRRIGRMSFPNNVQATTPAHQDFYYIRGSVDTYSCWVPLGDCPMSLGGLAVWPGTQALGFLDHTVHHPGAVGGCGVPIDPNRAVWHSVDYKAGDAIFFHCYMIHKALPNLTSDVLRVSTDNRYQRPDDAIDPGALLPHFNLD